MAGYELRLTRARVAEVTKVMKMDKLRHRPLVAEFLKAFPLKSVLEALSLTGQLLTTNQMVWFHRRRNSTAHLLSDRTTTAVKGSRGQLLK